MASQKFPHTFPMVGNTCTDKLCTAAAVHFLSPVKNKEKQ